jgi:hypothetical protein
MNSTPAPLATAGLLTSGQRRLIDDDRHFQRSIVTNCQGRDEIDLDIDDMLVVDPHERHGSSRRSDKDLAAVLAILDELNTETEDAP